jgi:hypothetical protein
MKAIEHKNTIPFIYIYIFFFSRHEKKQLISLVADVLLTSKQYNDTTSLKHQAEMK